MRFTTYASGETIRQTDKETYSSQSINQAIKIYFLNTILGAPRGDEVKTTWHVHRADVASRVKKTTGNKIKTENNERRKSGPSAGE